MVQTESFNDYLEIYEGPSSQKTLIKKFTGDVGSISHVWIGKVVGIRWKTDGPERYSNRRFSRRSRSRSRGFDLEDYYDYDEYTSMDAFIDF